MLKLIRRLTSRNRYFIVYLRARHPGGDWFGESTVTTHDGYFNRKEVMESVIEKRPKLSSVIIRNIIELNKKDYDTYVNMV